MRVRRVDVACRSVGGMQQSSLCKQADRGSRSSVDATRRDATRRDAMRFSSRSLQQGSGEPRVVGARPRALPAHDRQTLCDQYVGVVAERFSTSLPTQSVDKEPVAYVRPPSEHARRRAYAGAARRIELGGSERPVGDPHGDRRCAPPCRSCRGRLVRGYARVLHCCRLGRAVAAVCSSRSTAVRRMARAMSRRCWSASSRAASCATSVGDSATSRSLRRANPRLPVRAHHRFGESSSKRSARAGSCPFGTRADREDSADGRRRRDARECAPRNRTPLSYLSNAAPCRVGAVFGFAYSYGPSSRRGAFDIARHRIENEERHHETPGRSSDPVSYTHL